MTFLLIIKLNSTMSKNTFHLKVILLTLLVCFAFGAQPFYPEVTPTTDDIIFTATTKLKSFIISASYFTSTVANPNKFISKQAIILTATTNVNSIKFTNFYQLG